MREFVLHFPTLFPLQFNNNGNAVRVSNSLGTGTSGSGSVGLGYSCLFGMLRRSEDQKVQPCLDPYGCL